MKEFKKKEEEKNLRLPRPGGSGPRIYITQEDQYSRQSVNRIR
jgi:hypothetical protein